MKTYNYLLSVVILPTMLLLAGCAGTPTDYSRTSTMDLCVGYLSLPSYNINQRARVAELSRRGEDCSQYYEAARIKRQTDKQMLDTGMKLLNPPPRTYQQGTHTYIIDGRTVTCTTTGTVTHCF